MSDRILVGYASGTGATKGVAEAIGQRLTASGELVDVRPMEEVSDLSCYRAAVLGSAINGGAWLPSAIGFLESNKNQLRSIPIAIFLVCLTLAKKNTEQDRTRVSTWMEPARALVNPVAEGLFAGTLLYRNYSIPKGLGMRIFAATLGAGEKDYRDWDAIREWTDNILPLLLD